MDERENYLAKAKREAHRYLSAGSVKDAIASILSDLNKRDDTKPAQALVAFGLWVAVQDDHIQAVRFIDGFR